MSLIDTNLTFSKQVCDIAVGGMMGGGVVIYYLFKLLWMIILFYLIYRVTKIFIKGDRKK